MRYNIESLRLRASASVLALLLFQVCEGHSAGDTQLVGRVILSDRGLSLEIHNRSHKPLSILGFDGVASFQLFGETAGERTLIIVPKIPYQVLMLDRHSTKTPLVIGGGMRKAIKLVASDLLFMSPDDVIQEFRSARVDRWTLELMITTGSGKSKNRFLLLTGSGTTGMLDTAKWK